MIRNSLALPGMVIALTGILVLLFLLTHRPPTVIAPGIRPIIVTPHKMVTT